MPRAIVIEGPDGAGKSTLLHNLQRDMNREVAHGGGPRKDPVEWADRLMRMRDLARRRVLLDRIPLISEQVYGPLYGREADRTMTQELLEINPVIVFCCLPSVTEMMGNIDRGEKAHKPTAHTDLVLTHYPTIARTYKELMLNLACKGAQVIPYSWRDNHYPNLLEELKRCAD